MKTTANKKKRGLGKGLGDLIADATEIVDKAVASGDTTTLPMASLVAGVSQPRKNFLPEALEGLATSISEHGVLQPLLVRKTDDPKLYEIIAGERRFRAAKQAGLDSLPVVIKDISRKQAYEIALVENIQREDLSAIEEADGYKRMMEEFGYTQDMLSNTLGKSRSHIANTLRLLNLPSEIKAMLDCGQISAGHARALVGVENAYEIALEIANLALSVRDTEKFVIQKRIEIQNEDSQNNQNSKTLQTIKQTIEADNEEIETAAKNALKQYLGVEAKVAIKLSAKQNGPATMTIKLKNKSELQNILNKIK